MENDLEAGLGLHLLAQETPADLYGEHAEVHDHQEAAYVCDNCGCSSFAKQDGGATLICKTCGNVLSGHVEHVEHEFDQVLNVSFSIVDFTKLGQCPHNQDQSHQQAQGRQGRRGGAAQPKQL